jgi:POT family proton-dependent oligopeptide transporter
VFYASLGQISNNLISQAGQMKLYGIPNDTVQALNPIFCILLGPVIQMLYTHLSKRKIQFPPVSRIVVGFIFMSASMAYAAGVQKIIYNTGPCYDAPLACPASDDGRIPNQVSVFLQIPVYFILAIAEIFALVTLLEYTYSKAPIHMKSIVQAISQLASAAGSGVGIALSPAASDPKLVYLYTGLAVSTLLAAVLFWWKFKKYNEIDAELDDLEVRTESSTKEATTHPLSKESCMEEGK